MPRSEARTTQELRHVEKLQIGNFVIFRRNCVADESQTGMRFRECEAVLQGRRSFLADPLTKSNYSACVAKNIPNLPQKTEFFNTISATETLVLTAENDRSEPKVRIQSARFLNGLKSNSFKFAGISVVETCLQSVDRHGAMTSIC